MLKEVYFCGLVACCFFCLTTAESMVGDGKWEVLNIEKCDGWEQYDMKAEVVKHRINRSHEAFDAEIDTNGLTIDDSYACQIDVCKFVDGGCKPYQVIADDCFPRFLKKYAESNCATALEMAGIDPPDFPIEGNIVFKKYMFNYDELPIQGPYGEFIAEAFLIKNSVKVGCLKIRLEFSEIEEDDE